ncbi:MAG: hypothetical protein CMD81_09355 [Gammaproteobacteria bacterium]|nr:hypothetical protein [Gammaproteobacteria bacterium]HBF09187.1 hypothetical protein [Gammaproteobacteria bacterium]
MLNQTNTNDSFYKGRFAPSATGDLHMGSLVTSLACALDTYHNKGSWLIRIDDIDHTRCSQASSLSITQVLEHYFSDLPYSHIYHQSDTRSLYIKEFNRLASESLVYQCSCSRKDITALQQSQGTHLCRDKLISEFRDDTQDILRFKSSCTSLDEQLIEDAILFRRDGCFSYHFSCVVNDEYDDITHIIRGADLMDAEQPQAQLIKALGFRKLQYHYVPLIKNKSGQKLSKQNKALPITMSDDAPLTLRAALRHLQWSPNSLKSMPAENSIKALLNWAAKNWQPNLNFI